MRDNPEAQSAVGTEEKAAGLTAEVRLREDAAEGMGGPALEGRLIRRAVPAGVTRPGGKTRRNLEFHIVGAVAHPLGTFAIAPCRVPGGFHSWLPAVAETGA